jgi:cobalt-zinc-cadmium efflux system outer membrane protein
LFRVPPLAFGCLFLAGNCMAQTIEPSAAPVAQVLPTVAPPLSADDAVRAAVQNNPRLRAAVRDVTAARQGTRAAGALANPEAAFTPALTGGAQGGSDTEVFVQQPLELNGTRAARRGAAQARQRGAEAQAVVELRDLVADTRTAYYELVRAREQAAVARDLLKTAEELDAAARKQVDAGARPAIDQTQTAIEVTRARQQVTLTDATVVSREAALNAAMNRPPDAPIGGVGFDKISPPAGASSATNLPPLDEAVRLAFANRAELQVGGAAAEAFRQDARLARAEGVPDLAPQFRATSVTRGVQQSGFGLGITLPFLDYGNRRGRVRQAEESARAEESRIEARRSQVRQEVAEALAQARAADTVLATYTDARSGGLLEQSRRLLDASRLGYKEGKTTIVQLIEAQRTYRQTQNDYINAQVAAALARTELERVTGVFPATALPTASANTAAPRTIPTIQRTP